LWVRDGGAGTWRPRVPAPLTLAARETTVALSGPVLAAALCWAALGVLPARAALELQGTRFEAMAAPAVQVLLVAAALAAAALLRGLPELQARSRLRGLLPGWVASDAAEATAGAWVFALVVGALALVLERMPGPLAALWGEDPLRDARAVALINTIAALAFAAPLVAPAVYALVRAATGWRQPAAESTLWLVCPSTDRPAHRVVAAQLAAAQHHRGPVVLVTPPERFGEHVWLARHARRTEALFPVFEAALADWPRALPPPERWHGVPVREWHPPRALMVAAVRRAIAPQDRLVLVCGDVAELNAWQELARNRPARLVWLAATPPPASLFDAPAAAPPAPSPVEPLATTLARKRARLEAELAQQAHAAAEVQLPLMLELAQLRTEQGDLNGAADLQLAALARLKARPDADLALAAHAEHDLGETRYAQERFTDALAHFERALALRRRTLGEEHPATLDSLNSLGGAYWALSRFDDALRVLQAAVAQRSRVLGPEAPDTLISENNLIEVLVERGDKQTALQRREAQLATCRRTLGPGHSTTLNAEANLANLYNALGRQDEAIALHRHCLEARERELGVDHPDVQGSLTQLGGLLPPAQGRPLLERSLALARQLFGPAHPRTQAVEDALRDSGQVAGDAPAEAEAEAQAEVEAEAETASDDGAAASAEAASTVPGIATPRPLRLQPIGLEPDLTARLDQALRRCWQDHFAERTGQPTLWLDWRVGGPSQANGTVVAWTAGEALPAPPSSPSQGPPQLVVMSGRDPVLPWQPGEHWRWRLRRDAWDAQVLRDFLGVATGVDAAPRPTVTLLLLGARTSGLDPARQTAALDAAGLLLDDAAAVVVLLLGNQDFRPAAAERALETARAAGRRVFVILLDEAHDVPDDMTVIGRLQGLQGDARDEAFAQAAHMLRQQLLAEPPPLATA
jgi:tetratricopeptide (TPR) repeat protein